MRQNSFIGLEIHKPNENLISRDVFIFKKCGNIEEKHLNIRKQNPYWRRKLLQSVATGQ